MSWRPAKSLDVLLAELNAQFPLRDKASDGAIGDQAHAARHSDHNPDENRIVRARDYDEDLEGRGDADGEHLMARVAEHIRRMGEYGDHRLVGGEANGYVIYEKRIAGAGRGWAWRPYTGPNAHAHHMHVSVCSQPGPHGYDDPGPWHIADLFAHAETPSAPAPEPFEEDEMFYVIGYAHGTGRWFFWPQTNTKALIVDGAALAEAQKSKGYGGYLEMAEADLRAIPYTDPAKDPAA